MQLLVLKTVNEHILREIDRDQSGHAIHLWVSPIGQLKNEAANRKAGC